MNCKKCGFQLTENDQFCKNCGTPVDNMSVQNNNEGLNSQGYSQSNMQQQSMPQQSMNNYSQPAMQQPSWTSGYNAQPISQTPKNSNAKFIIIGIIAAIAIVGIIVAISAVGGNKLNNSGGGSSVINNSNSSYTVKFNGFTFKIPTNLVYETQSDSIILGDEDGTWAACIEVCKGYYSKVLSNKGELQGRYQSIGYTSSAAVEKTIGGMSFITLELSKDGTNSLFGITKANSMNLFGVTAYNIDNEYDYTLLEKISSILSTAEYNGETNNMSIFEKPDMSGIADLAK